MKIFIINLEQSTDRLAQQQAQFERLGLTFERLPAATVNDISETFYLQNLKHGQRLIKQTEMACFLSHKRAWEKVAQENQPCVILEDDAVLVRDFAEILAQIDALVNTPDNQLGGQMDLINLEVYGRTKIVGKSSTVSLLDQQYQLIPLLLDKSGTGGYILYPSGAKKLLKHAQSHFALADAFIYHCPSLNMYQIEPAALLQDDKCALYGIAITHASNSMIGQIQNTISFQPTLWQKIRFKKNRIITQISLGFRTIAALIQGEKRQIDVNTDKFHTKSQQL
ncbi:glycosyltransferase family 25 protein [Moraxella sp. ZJ142]|uniref:glycosyltransferase family 25 protein n=1 Tax=Moraxella marmotae TaxID=3344520 RepID=UPI0035D3F982